MRAHDDELAQRVVMRAATELLADYRVQIVTAATSANQPRMLTDLEARLVDLIGAGLVLLISDRAIGSAGTGTTGTIASPAPPGHWPDR